MIWYFSLNYYIASQQMPENLYKIDMELLTNSNKTTIQSLCIKYETKIFWVVTAVLLLQIPLKFIGDINTFTGIPTT